MRQKLVYVVGQEVATMDLFNRPGYHATVYDDVQPDLLVFTGGPDVNPRLYGEEKMTCTYPDHERENENIKYWDKWPAVTKVGICYGGQWLNCMSGGAMWQDVDGHGRPHDAINLLGIPGTKFGAGYEMTVTSSHHQMMIPYEPHAEVIMIANEAKLFKSWKQRIKPKYDAEVIWYESTKSLCFQPHPEWNTYPEHTEYFFKLLEHLTK